MLLLKMPIPFSPTAVTKEIMIITQEPAKLFPLNDFINILKSTDISKLTESPFLSRRRQKEACPNI